MTAPDTRAYNRDTTLDFSGDPETLLERGPELEALDHAVARVAARMGGAVLVEAPAGMGKTALLDAAVREAAEAGCLVRRVAPAPLERDFDFGVLRSLLEMPLREMPHRQVGDLLYGIARDAGELLLGGDAPPEEATTAVAHGALWLCMQLTEERPLVAVVDDAQWADRRSLEVLLYMARRANELPLLLLMAARTPDPDAASDLLTLFAGHPATTVLRPRPLTNEAAVRLVRRIAPDAPVALCRESNEEARGNPWLLGVLARQLAGHGAGDLDAPEPDTDVAREAVRLRLAALASRDRAVVTALAVAGDDAPPAVLAAVADVDVAELPSARDALAAAGVLGPGAEHFAHGLLSAAIAADLPAGEHARLHYVAAQALLTNSGDLDAVARHLVRSAPHAEPTVSELLARAAHAAWHRGEPDAANAYLRRAVAEDAPGDDREELLTQLALVAVDSGVADGRARLHEALSAVRVGVPRTDVLTRLALLTAADLGGSGLAEMLAERIAVEPDAGDRLALQTAALDALLTAPADLPERARRLREQAVDTATDPVQARTLAAHRAWAGVETGEIDAATCAALAVEALEGGVLLVEARGRAAFHLSVLVLILTDHYDEARPAIEALRAAAQALGSDGLRAAAAWYAALLALRTGRIAEAESEARLALRLADGHADAIAGSALGILIRALAAQGEFPRAHALLHEHGSDAGALGATGGEAAVLYGRTRLALAEGEFERALADARMLGALRERGGHANATKGGWRAAAAVALAHLGRREDAVELAEAELAVAERFGAPVPIADALHARMVAEVDPEARLALADRALTDVRAGGLEAMEIRLELGRTLRGLRRNTAAREPLQRLLADADAAGAVLLAKLARQELVATGLRPRRAQVSGASALTPRQREIAELAAAGVPNRVIAERLFLSVKTVETHLAAAFEKLGTRTRADLAEGLARQ